MCCTASCVLNKHILFWNNKVFNWILLIIMSYFSSFPLFPSGFLGNKVHSITLRSISFHSRLQLMCMERGDRLANRWVMCGLWMTYSGALRESVSKCSALRAELAPWSTNQFGEGGKINTRPIFTFSKQIQTLQICRFKAKKSIYVLLLDQSPAKGTRNMLFLVKLPFPNRW